MFREEKMSAKLKLSSTSKNTLLGFISVVIIYSLLGFLVAPLWAVKLAKEYVKTELHLDLVVGNLEINPLSLAVKIDGLMIKEPNGETLILAQQIYLNSNFWLSLWQRRIYLDELDIQQPYVNVHIDKTGQLNLLQLIPPKKEEEPSNIQWQLALFALHKASIDIQDDSRKQPFIKQINHLNLSLYHLSSALANQGNYQFSAQTAQQEKLTWKGSLGLNPVSSQGHFSLENLQLTTPASYVADLMPVDIKQGEFSVNADYWFELKDEQPQLKLTQGSIEINNVLAQTKAINPVAYILKRAQLKQFEMQWPQAQASFETLLLEAPQVGDVQNKHNILTVQDILLSQGAWQKQQNTITLNALTSHQISLFGQKQDLFQLPQIDITQFSIKDNKLNTGRITVLGGKANLQLFKNNQTNWQQQLALIMPRLMPVPSNNQAVVANNTPLMTYELGELAVNDFVVNAEDARQMPSFKEKITVKQLVIEPELDPIKPHQLAATLLLGSGGNMAIQGAFKELPVSLNATLNVNKLALAPLAYYLKDVALLKLKSGYLNVDGKLKVEQKNKMQASFEGAVAINDFAAHDLKLNERFLAWKRLVASGMTWHLNPMSLHIKQIRAEEPFSRVVIAPDSTINLQQVMISSNQTASKAASSSSSMMPLKVDKTSVINGSMFFADLTLKPQFATGIQALNGDISGISTVVNSHAVVNLQGKIDEYGKANIQGELNALNPDKNTNISLKFDNVELTTLTPYSSKFAGYVIDKGKLSLDLNYQIVNRQLVATNKVVLKQLILGERVDSPDAKNLPIRLAIALLKDSNGVIDVDIPITGSLDDPQFKVAPIIWQAFVNVITKAATAPFRFMANLVGGGDDMDSIVFAPIQSSLSQSELDKLAKVAQALQKRPALNLEIRASFDSQHESHLLKAQKIKQLLQTATERSGTELVALEKLYRQKFGQEALKQQVLQFEAKKTGAVHDSMAYQQALMQPLIDAQPSVAGELRQLALERAKTIRNQLVESQKIADNRVFILEPVDSVNDDKSSIITKITIKQP